MLRERLRRWKWYLIYHLLNGFIPTLFLYREDNRYRHVATGGEYRIIMGAWLEKTEEAMIIYLSLETGKCWIRPKAEFFDGRFVSVS